MFNCGIPKLLSVNQSTENCAHVRNILTILIMSVIINVALAVAVTGGFHLLCIRATCGNNWEYKDTQCKKAKIIVILTEQSFHCLLTLRDITWHTDIWMFLNCMLMRIFILIKILAVQNKPPIRSNLGLLFSVLLNKIIQS